LSTIHRSATIITTSRLRLVPFAIIDAPLIFALMNDADWKTNIGDFNIQTLADAETRLRERYLTVWEKYGYGPFRVERVSDNAQMGMCGLFRREGLAEADVGFAFLPAYRGQGYAAEATEAIIAYARDTLKLPGVLAIALPRNIASIKVLERAGLRFEETVVLPHDPDPLARYAIRFN
jgi:[ribosomal protein S5]-alanine N-acetyltransferase